MRYFAQKRVRAREAQLLIRDIVCDAGETIDGAVFCSCSRAANRYPAGLSIRPPESNLYG